MNHLYYEMRRLLPERDQSQLEGVNQTILMDVLHEMHPVLRVPLEKPSGLLLPLRTNQGIF